MPTYEVDALIADLSSASDLEKLLESKTISALQILVMLQSDRGRRILSARKKLARIHSRLVAARYSPFAVQRLCQLLMDEKPELRHKSAVSVLNVAGLATRSGKKTPSSSTPSELENLPDFTEEEIRAILQLLAHKLPVKTQSASKTPKRKHPDRAST